MRILPLEEAIYGLEWCAVDADGYVGDFLSMNKGPLPRSVAESPMDYHRIIGYFGLRAERDRGPIKCRVSTEFPKIWARLTRRPQREFEEIDKNWHLYGTATRGLYNYQAWDLASNPAPFFRMAAPVNPLHIDDVLPKYRKILQRTTFEDVRFADDEWIDYDAIDKPRYVPPHGCGSIPPSKDPGDIFVTTTYCSLESVRKIVAKNPTAIHARDERGYQPLHHAVFQGDPLIVRFLLESGTDVNAVSECPPQTPLQIAGDHDWNFEVTPLLVDAGAKLDAGHPDYSALRKAARARLSLVTDFLLARGAKPSMFTGVYLNDTQMIRACEQDERPDSQALAPMLRVAVRRRKVEAVEAVLSLGADANAVDDRKKTMLDIARDNLASPEIVELLQTYARPK